MLRDFLSHWNPINCLGREIDIDDLVDFPLQSHETLMQDSLDHFHRITVPSTHSSLWAQWLFWLQRHLNKNGHLEAIDNIISTLQNKILTLPLKDPSDMKKFKSQLEVLRSLKNDYFFTVLGQGDQSFIEQRLKIIEDQVYHRYVQNIQEEATDREQKRRLCFEKFSLDCSATMNYLRKESVKNIYAMRLLMVSTSEDLKSQFHACSSSIRFRIGLCQMLYLQIKKIEEENQGKFTIPNLEENLNQCRHKLLEAISQLMTEVELFAENLKINYFINPFQGEISDLLLSIKIDPAEIKDSWLNFRTLSNSLHEELEEVKRLVVK